MLPLKICIVFNYESVAMRNISHYDENPWSAGMRICSTANTLTPKLHQVTEPVATLTPQLHSDGQVDIYIYAGCA